MKNFAITAMGRSGTRFLAESMNISETWTVKHEAGRRHDMTRPRKVIQARFNHDHYGEVNGYLRFIIDNLAVEKRGIILRDPAELYLSITTWHSQPKRQSVLKKKWKGDFIEVTKAIPYLLTLAESGRYFVIDFHRMVSDREYLKGIFAHFGITDIRVTKEMIDTRINKTPDEVRRTTWSDFNPGVKDAMLRLSGNYQKRVDKIFGGGGV